MDEGLVIGLDGGGTKTVAWLARQDADAAVLGRGRAGPSNPCAVGLELAEQNVAAAIAAAFRDASLSPQPVAAACLALAGSDFESVGHHMETWAGRRQFAQRIRLTNDAEPILACTGLPWGIALIAGTGSFVLARNSQGETWKVGGWGYRAGDEGSAYWLATAGLEAAVWAADGRGPDTALLAGLLAHFQIREPRALVAKIYAPEMDRRAIANLSPLVITAAEQGDEVCRQLMDRAAAELARMVDVAARRLELPVELPLAATGGVVLNAASLRAHMLECLAQRGWQVAWNAVPDPVEGAVRLARQLAGVPGKPTAR